MEKAEAVEEVARLLAGVGEPSCWWGRMHPRLEQCELCDCSGQIPHHYRDMAQFAIPSLRKILLEDAQS